MNRRDWTYFGYGVWAACLVVAIILLVTLLDDQRCIRVDKAKVIRVYDAFSEEIDPLWVEHGTMREGVEAWLKE